MFFVLFLVAHKRASFTDFGSVKQVHFARVASTVEVVMSQAGQGPQGHGFD